MKISVIGSGISGLGAAWSLSRRHDVEVSRVRGSRLQHPVSYIYRPRPDGSLERVAAEVDDIFGDTPCYLLVDRQARDAGSVAP